MRRLIIIATLIVTFFAFFAGSCEDPGANQRAASTKARASAFDRAQKRYPLPHTENFPLRKMLIEMTKREDLDNHPWYVYHMGQDGNVIGYYVAKTVPINACDMLSSTEQITDGYGDETGSGNVVVHAPSLDGIYYGESACNTYVWQDYSTDAIVKVTLASGTVVTVDKPLNIEAEAIRVKGGH